jgi:hypothetical protein
MRFDEGYACRAARERLESKRPAPGKQIEDARRLDPAAKDGK